MRPRSECAGKQVARALTCRSPPSRLCASVPPCVLFLKHETLDIFYLRIENKRMARLQKSEVLKPQDILVLLKLVLEENRKNAWNYKEIGQDLGISNSEAFQAVRRAKAARLFIPGEERQPGKVARRSLEEFVLHGLKYAFPAQLGPNRRGLPTAHSGAPLNQKIVSSRNYVWNYPDGQVNGETIEPLYPSVPFAASKDPALHQLLALVDALRVGRARERSMAAEELHNRLAIA